MMIKEIFGVNKTVEHFPDDWIEPGEFRWCQSGFHLLPSNHAMVCSICNGTETKAELIFENTLRNVRNKLARERKESGRPPLFWMRDQQSTCNS